MLNPVCDWICEEVLYKHLILATFKNKFICDQAINPKISLVLVQVMVPYFKAVSQTQAKLYIYIYIHIYISLESKIRCACDLFANPVIIYGKTEFSISNQGHVIQITSRN